MLLVGWELVGICSFLLIGFWWEEKQQLQNAAIKAFITTKFGDIGLVDRGDHLMGHLWRRSGSATSSEMAREGTQAGGEPLNTGLLTLRTC